MLKEDSGKLGVSLSRGLSQAIQRFIEPAHQVFSFARITKREVHVHLFIKVPIYESIINVQL